MVGKATVGTDHKRVQKTEKIHDYSGARRKEESHEEYAKNAIVERFNRTIRNVMRKYEAEYPRSGIVDDWQDLIEGYNESYHRTIKAEPMDVWEGKAKNKQDYKDINTLFA